MIRGMATPRELAAFLVTQCAAVARLDRTLGPNEDDFRRLAVDQITDGVPIPYELADVGQRLLDGAADPVTALSGMLAEHAKAYSYAASRACALIVSEAIEHLREAGDEEAVERFLDGLDARSAQEAEQGGPQ
jgi:hypothetical protein